MDNARHNAVNALSAREPAQHLAHRVLIPLVVALHLLQHLQAGLRLAQRAARALNTSAQLLIFRLQRTLTRQRFGALFLQLIQIGPRVVQLFLCAFDLSLRGFHRFPTGPPALFEHA